MDKEIYGTLWVDCHSFFVFSQNFYHIFFSVIIQGILHLYHLFMDISSPDLYIRDFTIVNNGVLLP